MVDNNFKIRLARTDDLPLIREIERAAGELFRETEFSFVADDEPMSIEILREHQREGDVRVAVDNKDQPIGFAVTCIIDGAVHLHEISIHPAQGRKGVGRQLIFAVCEWAKEKGKSAVTLSTFQNIAWNAPYYARLGFRTLEEQELTDGLREIRTHEAQLGLPIDRRVCMRREI
jgi:predicted N-acetyltransferase YhbS